MKPLKKYILPLLLLLVFTSSKAQILYAEPFGTASGDMAIDIIIGSDSNYIMLGRYYQNIYLAKADTAAQLIWEKSYFIPSINTQPNSICEIGDTSFVIGGVIDSKGYLLKVNAVGDSLFSLLDTTITGNNVSNLRQAPDGNLLALVTFNGNGTSLVKFDDNLNVINTINNIVPAIKGIEVVNNKIYLLKQDSINNFLIVSNNLIQIDTVTVPLKFPVYLRTSFNQTQLIIEGTFTSYLYSLRKRIFIDSLGNVELLCDSIDPIYDIFKSVNPYNNGVQIGYYYNATWGIDIRLYFTDSCGQILHDTILYRPGTFTDPWREEWGVKLLVDHKGNYVIYARGEKGPLGDWDIFLMIYKKWDGFVTGIDSVDSNDQKEPIIITDFAIFPNPTQNQFTITGILENSSITVTDVMGKVVYYATNVIYQTQINATNWAKGMYIAQLKGTQSSTALKVIKQ